MIQRLPLHGFVRLSALCVTLAILLATTGGCVGALATMMWVIKGSNVAPDYEGLQEKRVVVVCRPVTGLELGSQNVARELAREMTSLLKRNVRRITVVEAREVEEWMDEYTWDEYTEIGQALEADVVVGVELEHFGVLAGQTIFQGKANIVLKVYDCETNELIYEKYPPQFVYPPNRVVSATEQQERDFRREFIRILADQVARHFYPHDPRADFAL